MLREHILLVTDTDLYERIGLYISSAVFRILFTGVMDLEECFHDRI